MQGKRAGVFLRNLKIVDKETREILRLVGVMRGEFTVRFFRQQK